MLKLREALSMLKACLRVFPAPAVLWGWLRNNGTTLSVLISLSALLLSIFTMWQNSEVLQHQRQETRLTMARQVTVTLRRFDPNVDPFVWGSENRELMKNIFVTVQVFNDGDAEVQDVVVDLLTVKHGEWTLLGQEKFDRLGPHKESPAVVGGAAGYDDLLALAKGRVTFTDKHGSRWVRWSDGRLLAK